MTIRAPWCYVVVFSLFCLGFFAAHAPAWAAPDASMASCGEGVERCAPLARDPAKYQRCMELVCPQALSSQDARQEWFTLRSVGEGKQACDIGQRKCRALQRQPDLYWECMEDTCSRPIDVNPHCEAGKVECADLLTRYQLCVNLVCKAPAGQHASCAQGQEACATPLATYWQCVERACLGGVEAYYDRSEPVYTTRQMGPGGRLRPAVRARELDRELGVAPRFATPPEGVSALQWYGALPLERRINNNPAAHLRCTTKGASLHCWSQDIQSCRCSDQSIPVPFHPDVKMFSRP